MTYRSLVALAGFAFASSMLVDCGGSHNSTPAAPQPPTVPSQGGPSVNLAPVIDAITLSSERAEVDSEITVTATVKDDETPVDQLMFEWKADAGTFSGGGASIKWRAPKNISTPADYTIALTVKENYGTPDSTGVRPQNVSTATSPVIRVHNSPKELGDMSLLFLSDFANSSLSSSTCLRNFSDSCRGKADEKSDIDYNRDHFLILSSSLNLKRVSIGSSGNNANVTVACSFRSRITKCSTSSSCTVGSVESVAGDCELTGVYDQRRWWLCDSHFTNGVLLPSMRGFFGIR